MDKEQKLPSPVNPPVTGKIQTIVAGKVTVKSSDPRVVIERRG